MTDPIADLLTRIRNAVLAKHDSLELPASKLKRRIVEILKEEGYISGFTSDESGVQGTIRVDLKWVDGRENAIRALKRESKPGRRVYVKADQIPSVRNGHGIAIVSTSRGVLVGREARKIGVGGEYICSVY